MKQARPKSSVRLFLILFFIVPATAPTFAQSTAGGADGEGAGGEGTSEAQTEFREIVTRLENGSLSAEEYSTLLARAISLTSNVRIEQELRSRYAEKVPRAERGALYGRLAETAELLGDFQRAAEFYGQASAAGSGDAKVDFQHHRAALLLELGRAEEAEEVAESALNSVVAVSIQRDSALLLGRIKSVLGKHEKALELLEGLAATRPLSEVDPKVFLALYEAAARAGRQELMQSARSTLREAYPESPERALLDEERSSALSFFPAPSRLFESGETVAGFDAEVEKGSEAESRTDDQSADGSDASSRGSESQAAAQPEQADATGVQTGSFTDRSNAEAMLQELHELGFTPEISRIKLGDTTYFRVIVPAGAEESATDLQFRLKIEGYDGMLVFGDA